MQESVFPMFRRLFIANLLFLMVYGGIVLIQNHRFWSGAPEEKIGILFDQGMMEQAGISCPGPIAIRLDTPVAQYRCSTTGMVIGAFSLQHPIIPWPAYEDGENPKLAGIIEAALANAKH